MENMEIGLAMGCMAALIIVLLVIILDAKHEKNKLKLKGIRQEQRITGLLIAIDRYAEREKSHVLHLEEYRSQKWVK